jgi:hypothetical protein
MNGWYRATATLVAAAAGGVLLWVAAQFDRGTTGGYWAMLGVIAGCGLLLGLAQLRGTGGNPPAMFLVAFVPVLVCAGWALLFAQPDPNWFRSHIRAWSGDIHIRGIVHDISTFAGVLAFGIGLVFAAVLERGMVARRVHVVDDAPAAAPEPVVHRRPAPAYDDGAADEPTYAEREEVDSGPTVVRRPWYRGGVRVR